LTQQISGQHNNLLEFTVAADSKWCHPWLESLEEGWEWGEGKTCLLHAAEERLCHEKAGSWNTERERTSV